MRLLVVLFTALLAWGQEPPSAKISGKVVDSLTLTPLKRATVLLFGNSAETADGLRTTSDSEGKFSFDKLGEGIYELRGEKNGYLYSSFGARRSGLGDIPIPLTKGEERKDLQLKLIPQGVISGKVFDQEGDPLDHVSLSLLLRVPGNSQRRLERAAETQANEKGEFRFAGIAPGKYYLSLRRNDRWASATVQGSEEEQSFTRVFFPGVESSDQAQTIDVSAGQEINSLLLTMRKSRVFRARGRFTGEPNASSGSRLLFVKRHEQTGDDSDTIESQNQSFFFKDNRFEARRLSPGTYSLLVMDFTARGPRLAGQLDVTVSNANLEQLEVPPVRLATISGNIKVEEPANAVDSKKLRLYLAPVEQFGLNLINLDPQQDGSFSSKKVSPVQWRIIVEMGDQNLYLKSIRQGSKELIDQVVNLRDGDALEVEVILSAKVGQIEGNIETGAKAAAFGRVLVWKEGTGMPSLFAVDRAGKFSATCLGPGTYTLYAMEGYDNSVADPELFKKLSDKSIKIELKEGETKSVSLKQISWDEIEKARN